MSEETRGFTMKSLNELTRAADAAWEVKEDADAKVEAALSAAQKAIMEWTNAVEARNAAWTVWDKADVAEMQERVDATRETAIAARNAKRAPKVQVSP